MLLSTNASSQTREERLKNHIYYFASDSLQGREAGTEYSAKAADYIISEFEQIGVIPLFESGWKMEFTNPAYPGRKFADVVGMIPGSDPEFMNELIVVGAHFDHLGVRSDGEVFNGADDNASGSAALIEIARLLKQNQQNLKRTVVLAGFDAEEIGLYGSSALSDAFRKNSLIPNVKLMISVDMVGWLEKGGALTLEGVATIKDGKKVLQKYASSCDLSLKLKNFERSILTATDTESFAQMHVPTLAVTTGLKSPYHKVGDDADLIDYRGLDKISVYMADVVSDIASDPFFLSSGKVAPKHRNPVPAFEIAPKVGIGKSTLRFPGSSINAKAAFSYEAGLAAKLNFSYFALQAEGLYSVESSYFPVESDLFGSKDTYKMSSVTVPAYLMVQFQDRLQRGCVGVGPYYKRVLDSSYGDTMTNAPAVNSNQFGASVILGAGIGHLTVSFDGR
ncbi:MAG: M20/M25/M40 family metallo-hydrolase [Bacteroidales bacterium]|nr:M20/M25/M40 family metallo-hydrolase [Bacteroidales bacterium]